MKKRNTNAAYADDPRQPKLMKGPKGDVSLSSSTSKRVEAISPDKLFSSPACSSAASSSSASSSNTSPNLGRKEGNFKMYRVCLTGGPCAGKSTALSMLKTRLLSMGYHVILVPENATDVFNNIGGYDPVWQVEREKHCILQRSLLEYQIYQEKLYATMAKLRQKDCVILYDRGTLDVKCFMLPHEWDAMLLSMGITERELRDAYDVVVHMITAAIGAREHYEYGEGSRNPQRFHNADQAAEVDIKGLQSYSGHPMLKIINNDTDFPTKVEKVLAAIMEALERPIPTRHRHRLFVKTISDSQITVPFSSADLWVTYLLPASKNTSESSTTRTVRKRGQEGCFQYSLRTVTASGLGAAKDAESLAEAEGLEECGDVIVTEKQICEEQYDNYRQIRDPARKEVHKRLRYFIYGYHYFVLNEYISPKSDKTILDCEIERMSEVVELPPFIESCSPDLKGQWSRSAGHHQHHSHHSASAAATASGGECVSKCNSLDTTKTNLSSSAMDVDDDDLTCYTQVIASK